VSFPFLNPFLTIITAEKMSSSGASLLQSFLGALQASLSVLLTLSYGVLAAHLRLIHDYSVKDVSNLCVKMFLPALLLTNIGSQLSVDKIDNYAPVFGMSRYLGHAVGR
jgi:auxin efflux carrier family protein